MRDQKDSKTKATYMFTFVNVFVGFFIASFWVRDVVGLSESLLGFIITEMIIVRAIGIFLTESDEKMKIKIVRRKFVNKIKEESDENKKDKLRL